MKKILLLTLISTLVLTGCGKKEENKFDKYEENNKATVEDVKGIELEDGTNEFKNMMVLDNNTLETQFGLTVNDVDNYVAQVSYELDARMYVAIKPAKDKTDKVKKMMGLYIDSVKTRLEMEKNNLGPSTTTNEAGETVEVPADTTYLDSQINMIKNYHFEEYNGYLIWVSSSSNEKIVNIIKSKLN